MLERVQLALKILCLGLSSLIVYQASSLLAHQSSLAHLQLPVPFSTEDLRRPLEDHTGTNLPPAIRSRVDTISQSEILGAVIRPLPMALLGIAGQEVFLRTADGQTALLHEGDELGGVKLLRIGTNRVVVEHEGQQKELTLFSGLGSQPLLPVERKTP